MNASFLATLLSIFLSSILTENYILSKFLGICPFLGVSKKLDTATGMSLAVIVVMVISTAVTFPIEQFLLKPLDIDYLQVVVFILVIASLVQLIETILKKFVPALYQSLGIYLPLITTNCAVLGITQLVLTKGENYGQALVNAFGSGVGFLVAMVIFAGVRERLAHNPIPKFLEGLPITLISASLTAASFLGFAGVVDGIFGPITLTAPTSNVMELTGAAQVLVPIILVCVIGIVFGLILAIASTVLEVPKDQKEEDIRAMLPGANCGACGFSGCDGYAAALAKGEAKPGLCAPGGPAVAKAIGEYLGVGGADVEQKVAVVCCMGNDDNSTDRVAYEGIDRCAAANLVAGGKASCNYGCLAEGDCVRACQYNAIEICNGVAIVDDTRCVGCTMCAQACPRHLIAMVPKRRKAVNRCSNCDKGAATSKVCRVGCIGCGKCMRACPKGAITIENACAKVDYEKCVGCGLCTKECPRHCLTMLLVPKPVPVVPAATAAKVSK